MTWEFILQRTTDNNNNKNLLPTKSLKNKTYLPVYIRLLSRCYIIMNQLRAYVIKITFRNANIEDFFLKKALLKF